jgi:hypothetical protein
VSKTGASDRAAEIKVRRGKSKLGSFQLSFLELGTPVGLGDETSEGRNVWMALCVQLKRNWP